MAATSCKSVHAFHLRLFPGSETAFLEVLSMSSAVKSHECIGLLLLVVICRNSITWEKAEGLKQEHCYIAEDYHRELSIFEVWISW